MNPKLKLWSWLFIALLAHSGWGCFPGFARYLQIRADIDALLVVSVAVVPPTVIVGIPLMYKHGIFGVFQMNKLWLYCTFVIFLDVPYVYAARYTLSVNVQLILLATPFFVVLLSKLLLKTEVPPWTWTAMVMSTIGAFLALFGDMQMSITRDDVIGYSLSLLASFGIGGYIVFVSNVEQKVSSFVVTWLYYACAAVVLTPISYFTDDWSVIADLELADWAYWITFSLGLLGVANLLIVVAIRELGAAVVGTMLPWRLVAALIFGALALDETLSLLNMAGSAIVVVTLICYLYYQYWRGTVYDPVKTVVENPVESNKLIVEVSK